MEELPQTYRKMIHGEYIGKPVVKLFADAVAPVDNDF